MIGNLVGRREKTEDEALQQNGYSARRTFARFSFANHMDRLGSRLFVRQAPQNERKC